VSVQARSSQNAPLCFAAFAILLGCSGQDTSSSSGAAGAGNHGGGSGDGGAGHAGGASAGGGGAGGGVGGDATGGGGAGSGVAAPKPPKPCPIPSGATMVTTTAELKAALSTSQPIDIVLADGGYDDAQAFENGGGHHLYAQHLGGAVLHAGLVIGGNSGSVGGLVCGVAFDVDDPAKTFQGGIINTWGNAGESASVLDCTFQGHQAVPTGVLAYNPNGLTAERLELRGFTDVGIRASDNTTVAYGDPTPKLASVADVVVDGVVANPPGASNGTGEAGLFIGHPVVGGVHRIKVRNVYWSGIETANNAWDTTYTDLDIDMSYGGGENGTGVYLEHFSEHLVFHTFLVASAHHGYNSEWDDPAWGNVAAGHFNTIEQGRIQGGSAGVNLDEGTESTTVQDVTFVGQSWAGIGAYDTVGADVFVHNHFSGLGPGAVPISHDHAP
jgi:hypothetical protein